MSDAPVRTVIVHPPTGEGRAVVRALSVVFYGTALLMAVRWCGGSSAKPAEALYPDEVAFRELPADDQRTFRAALGGLGDATDVRARTGAWPSVAELAAAHVPPFAPDPIDHAGYAWTLLRDGLVVDYVGTPSATSGRPTFAIIMLEPDPGMPVDPEAITDEQHSKLADGTLLHVAIWRGPHSMTTATATPRYELGWQRITTRTP